MILEIKIVLSLMEIIRDPKKNQDDWSPLVILELDILYSGNERGEKIVVDGTVCFPAAVTIPFLSS